MEQYFDSIFEDVRHERSLTLILSIVEPDILGQSKFLDHERLLKILILKNYIDNVILKKLMLENY